MTGPEPRWIPRLVIETVQLDQIREHGGLIGIRDDDALAARGQNPHGVRAAKHPGWTAEPTRSRCKLQFPRCHGYHTFHPFQALLCVAPRANSAAIPLSSRLASAAPPRSRRSRGFIHGLLEAALARARHRWTYEPDTDLADLAACYVFGICTGHPFRDGNKRISFLAGVIFLGLNGFAFVAPEDEVVEKMVGLADGRLDEQATGEWIRSRIEAAP